VADAPKYRPRVVARLPQLIELDGAPITPQHKQKSHALLDNDPLSDLGNRRATWAASVAYRGHAADPGAAFVDYMPVFVE